MAEEVETGGLMRFRYSGEQTKLSEDKKKEIERAYQEADERKRREKQQKILFLILGILVLVTIGIGLYVYLK